MEERSQFQVYIKAMSQNRNEMVGITGLYFKTILKKTESAKVERKSSKKNINTLHRKGHTDQQNGTEPGQRKPPAPQSYNRQNGDRRVSVIACCAIRVREGQMTHRVFVSQASWKTR